MKAVHRVLDIHAPQAPMPDGLCALGVMTKAPRAGKVKTRLSPPLTPLEAAALNVCFLRDTGAAISAATRDNAARGVGVYTPVGEEAAWTGILPDDFDLIAQRGREFGERLTFATEDLFRCGFASVCLIDSDSPTVPQSAYAYAVTALHESGDRIVFGPSDDGGYYLIGMKESHRELFQAIEWSTDRVAEQTLARAAELKLKVRMLPTWYDVDDRTTLQRLCDELLSPSRGEGEGYAAPRTRDYLATIVKNEGRDRIWPATM
ncbi:MAG TPA: TIGR04282 family arsenosugar biosynthesis glycosyltransferase [Chthoniobacterales bacterium]|nr:TIGR04282 family arsenosugar biosynthesis glycosyltransferase [Chthoniobacterales bacterium]